jgi:hypothetical protein
MTILNLMDDTPAAKDSDATMTDDQQYPSNTQDHWMENANQIDASITQMANMISKNQRAYVTPHDLDDEEASVLESTVLSFSATAANQIDSLRAAIDPQHHSSDYVHYCSGIVAALLLRLENQVANPMALLQKQRTRTAMTIYQQPLSCRYIVKEASTNTQGVWDQLVEDDDDDDATTRRFQPQHAAPSMSTDFMAMYATNATDGNEAIPSKPVSLFQKRQTSTTTDDDDSIQEPPAKHVKFASFNKTKQIKEERLLYHEQQEQVHFQEEAQQEMQKEAVLLEASLQNDLDSVYQVEQSMTQITALLSQFSALVSEQQEEIITIHDTTLTSKENVSKGQESLIDAKERTKKAKNYMASLVWSVAMILLFFNYITP